jgi:hypothetical protein
MRALIYPIPENSHIKNSPQKYITALLHKMSESAGILRKSFCAKEKSLHVHIKPNLNIP